MQGMTLFYDRARAAWRLSLNSQSWLIPITIIVLWLNFGSTFVLSQGFTTGCQLGFQKIAQEHAIDRLCGVSGSATELGLRLQDTIKNNFCASGQPTVLDFNDFMRLQKAMEARKARFGSEATLATDRRAFTKVKIGSKHLEIGEGSLVRLAGIMVAKHYSAWAEAESINCRLQGAENADIQVTLAPRSGDDLCRSVLVEISPHMRPWQWVRLLELNTQSPMRFTGQLFFDASHKTCASGEPHELKRGSLWEIHPVYGIDICKRDTLEQCDAGDDSLWLPLDQWKNDKGAAVKLAFNSYATTTRANQPFRLEVALRNAADELSSRAADTKAQIKASFSSGRTATWPVTIPAGKPSADVSLQLEEPGVVKIEAKAPGLRSAGMVLNVLPVSSRYWLEKGSGPLELAAYSLHRSRYGQNDGPPRGLSHEQKTRIRIFSSPARELMANGSDAATISAMVDGDTAHQDIAIRLHSTLGIFEPCDSDEHALTGVCPDTVLVIPKGSGSGFVQLQSKNTGEAKISYVPTRQDIVIEDVPQDIQFGPPITRIVVKASPPRISLVDHSSILVQFTDENGKVYVPARARRLVISIQRGEGRLEANDNTMVVAPPNMNAATSFTPGFWLGEVDLEVTADELASTRLKLYVAPPIWLLLISLIGGLAGGVIAYQQDRQNASLWRIPIGGITGFVFYWAFMFELFTAKPTVFNPLSDFALSILGGWAGTNLFRFLLKRLGVEA